MISISNFDDFGQDALRSEELPTIIGGVERNEDFYFPSSESEDDLQIES
jgi:hypothetical protein